MKRILEWADFTVKTRGDLLDARFDRREARQILSRLMILGILQGKTRLLDMALTGEDQVNEMTEAFQQRYAGYLYS
jgi:pyruvate, water dikinase